MSGIGLVLNIAKNALITQQYAMDVVSHNIANVSTEGYSRQTATIQSMTPAPYGGFVFGRGTTLESITRQVDAFVENRLRERSSDLAASTEMETYLKVVESVFDENSGRSINSLLYSFWNAWHDLSNNPSGSAERTILYESGSLLSQAFQDIRNDLDSFDLELNLSLEAATGEVNQLTAQIAELNGQIMNMEIDGNANDLRDQRDNLVQKLASFLEINTFSDSQGCITVTTGRGYTLVNKTSTYDLSFEGGEVKWESSVGQIPVTDSVQSGKMGGWLEMRDEILPKYKNELDELAGTLIWEVNNVHSQGVGLTGSDDLTGTYETADAGEELMTADSGLDFYDKISAGSFTVWVYDSNGDPDHSGTINVTATTTLNDVIADIGASGTGIANITATAVDGKLRLEADSGYSFGFADDTSGVLAALGLNTFFDGSDSLSMDMNETLASNQDLIAAGRADGSGQTAAGDNTNALALAALRDDDGIALERYDYDGNTTASTDTFQGYYAYLVGSVGIKSASVQREQEYAEIVVNQLTEQRNDFSAVSLDEEMTNLIKFQQAYSAAARLISTADEMFQTLLETR